MLYHKLDIIYNCTKNRKVNLWHPTKKWRWDFLPRLQDTGSQKGEVESMIVSIDIGTSYSSISALGPDGKAHPIEIGTGASMFGSKFSLPSAVFVEDSGDILVGQAAFNQRKLAPARFRMEFKRNLGEAVPIVLGSRSFLPEQLYTELIRHMKAQAEKTGDAISCAYMTFPASYGKAKKEKLLTAARMAGLFDVQLVEEPTAAAMSYCAAGYVQDGQTLLTYDFGGGTFDAALLRYEGGSFRLLTEPVGLPDCGGVDMDRVIFQDMVGMVGPEVMTSLMKNPVNMMRFSSQLGELAVKAKHHLSFAEAFQEYIPVGFDVVPYELNREKFDGMIAAMVNDTVDICRKMLDQAGLKIEDLSSVLMVGGTSRVPLVQKMVHKMAGSVPVYSAADLDLAVAQGALNYRMMENRREQPEFQGVWEPKTEKNIPPEPKQAPAAAPPDPEYILPQEPVPEPEALDEEQLAAMMQQAENLLNGPEPDPQQAAALCEQAVAEGYGPAQYLLGSLYLEGSMLEQNLVRGAALIRQAAEQEITQAQYVLGSLLLSGQGISRDSEQGCMWLQKAAQQGSHPALCTLADCYREGNGVQKDLAHAITIYQQAERLQASDAVNLGLGLCYLERKESPEELEMALDRLYRAAEQGNATAMYTLGECCKKGIGVEKDSNQASAWCRAAADRGNADAQLDLATVYRFGMGQLHDRCLWFYWVQQAAEDPGPSGCYARDLIQELDSQEYEHLTEQIQELCRDAAQAGENWAEFICGLVDECMADCDVDLSSPRFNHSKAELQRTLMEIPGRERTILSLDTSGWGNAKSGVIMTNRGIYNKDSWLETDFASWLELATEEISPALFSGQIRFSDNRILMDTNGSYSGRQLLNAILAIQQRLQRLHRFNPYLIQEGNDRT